MTDIIRLAVCQIECHPALYRGRMTFLEEPFVPASYQSSLSHLGSLGIQVTEIQRVCKSEYISWHIERIKSILSHPLLNGEIPSIVIFPEGSIPINFLSTLYDYAKLKNNVIMAGTHTILETVEAKQIYSLLGKEKDLVKRHSQLRDASFIFVGDKVHLHKKVGISPFDRSEVSPLSVDLPRTTIHPIPVPIGNTSLRMVALVCADALQLPIIKGDYDIVCISSYDGDPHHFDSFIDTQTKNGKVAMYCNDGKYGGSSINLPMDQRIINGFFDGPFNGRLPSGDGILILDVPVGTRATQVGVLNPMAQFELKLLTSLTYADSVDQNQSVSKELIEIMMIDNNQARRDRIETILKKHQYNTSQKYRLLYLRELADKGTDTDDVWAAYGQDIMVASHDLKTLESKFAEECYNKLIPSFVTGIIPSANLLPLRDYLQICDKRRLNINKPLISDQSAKEKKVIVDREDETESILSFFDDRKETCLIITGLSQIGKSETLDKALDRMPDAKIKKIPLLKTSSTAYIIAEICEKGKYSNISECLATLNILCLSNCENILEAGKWKSPDIDDLIKNIICVAEEEQVKLVFESIISLPLDLVDPSVSKIVRIQGFERDSFKYGVAIMDDQLRRLGMNPNDLNNDIKKKLVNDLGGHPLAIILCVDAIYDQGLTEVLDVVRHGTGFIANL